MRRFIRIIVEILIIFIVIFLMGIWVFPWKKKSVSQIKKDKIGGSKGYIIKEHDVENSSLALEKIAVLFGREEGNTNVYEKKIRQEPEEATWIRPLGYVRGSDDKKYYFLKNEKSNKILKLSFGSVDKGYRLIEIDDRGLIFEFEGKRYIVREDQ